MSNETNQTDSANENIRKPVSIRLLYDGMTVHDDIYDSSGDRMLMSAGSVLTMDHIERMHRLNSGSDVIYVTGRTHKTMVSKMPNIEIQKREELEKSTGYTDALAKVHKLFEVTAKTKKVDRSGYNEVSKELAQRLKATPAGSIIAVVNDVAPVDEYLQRHAINVAMLNGLFGTWIGLPEDQIDRLMFSGLLHDCGHALMPPSILLGTHRITRVEYEVLKKHAVHADELLSAFPDDIRLAASAHHERIDGSGYPKALSGDAISGTARITAISDIYDGIVSTRSYRPPRSPFCAVATMDNMAPTQVDAAVVKVFREKLLPELVGRPVTMSDGTIGIIRENDPNDIEHPSVEVGGRAIKTSKKLYCVSMYLDE